MGMGMDMASIVAALRKLEEEEQNRSKDYGDIAKVLKSNPLIAALANYVVDSLYSRVLEELDRRMVPPKRQLLTIEQVAVMMDRSVEAVRKLRQRGKLEAVPGRMNGRVMFAEEAVGAAMVAGAVRANLAD